MSLDTSQWDVGFVSPSVCQNIRFSFTELQLRMNTHSVIEFVQKYSSIFQQVKIEYITFEEMELINSWCQHLIEFLQILTRNSQLISIKFFNLSECFEKIDISIYIDICRKIADFLVSQHRLKRVEFRNCCFGYHEGVELLQKLAENNKESLNHLQLEQFILFEPNHKEQDSISLQNKLSFVDFPSLTTLKMEYTLTFEKLAACHSTKIQTVKNCNTLALSKIVLSYKNETTPIEECRGLTSSDWHFLKMLSPHLEVEFSIYTNSPSRRELEFLILPNMPVSRLIYYLYSSPEMEMDTNALFSHLLACKTNEYLVSLEMSCDLPIFSSTIAPFLQDCRKLKYFTLSVSYTNSDIDVLMESWLETRPESLEEVELSIEQIKADDECANLKRLESLLKLSGMNINALYL